MKMSIIRRKLTTYCYDYQLADDQSEVVLSSLAAVVLVSAVQTVALVLLLASQLVLHCNI